jgi:DedD protein
LAQDDYYYEIQLTNKQLVFYFMAGASGLILSFLVGVMVGRGVDASAGEVQAARPVVEERVVTEEPVTAPSAAPAEDLTYAQRLEGDRADEPALETKPAPAASLKPSPPTRAASVTPPAPRPASDPPTGAALPRAAAKAPSPKPTARAAAAPAPAGPASFTIQVGAFKDRATAESVVGRLKSKGFAAYVVTPEGDAAGLYNVRVGSYPARADAERVQTRLRDQEKFKPFIVRN